LPKDNVYHLKPFQDKFIFTPSRFPALVSAWGTGKTFSLITRALKSCKEHSNNLGLIVRKEFTDLRDSTIRDFEKYTGMKLNGSRDAVFPNGSTIMFRHLEELHGHNLQNMNLGFYGIEQAEELDTDEVFMVLRGRLRREGVDHWGAIIANTNGHNWIYNTWKVNPQKEFELSEATTFDNADILPATFIEDLKRLETEKPKVYRRFVMNSWDDTDAVDLVIDPEWVRNSKARQLYMVHPIKKIVTIDVARYGDDKTVFYAIESSQDELFRTIAKESHEKKSTMEIVGRAVLFAQKHGIKAFAVDEIGVGAGVVDRLKELGHQVIAVNSSEKSNDPEKYYNTRAEIYAKGAELFQDNKVSVLADDIELQEQLSWAKYKVIKSNGLIQIEAKDDIKERYGRSPDNADAFLAGLWALRRVRQEKNPETMHEEKVGWQGGNYTPEWAQVVQIERYR
jgi:hypothetical protein